jgi:Polyketide cyclase / dehydrase and lipid transport
VERSTQGDADSCELVAVRIERTSANSRRICGEITVPAPLRDVWAILTDYNRLSVHVPNLVESKIERVLPSAGGDAATMGDGQFECRLYQKGAQRIVGFEFGASVTMHMKEVVRARLGTHEFNERKILFTCVDSFFFDQFDGEWSVVERTADPTGGGGPETVLSYTVDVRPRGPVPVAALEWRIREDVPTNLRAVKRAALAVGYDGVMRTRPKRFRTGGVSASSLSKVSGGGVGPLALVRDSRVKVEWYKDETMAAYLSDQ